jgi:hippurate hydrolase
MLGTAKLLASLKDQWHGTLVIIGQPAEETSHGAKAMLADGLYSRFPKPDFVVALHDSADLEAGKVGYTSGYALASATSVDLKIRGVGGHGARPASAKDPIVLAAQIILGLQTLVSRENSPLDPAVITVGSIHGGTKHNIIPEEVNLQITVRAYRDEVLQKLLSGIERIAKGMALAAGIPENLAPIINVSSESTPATYNDPVLTERLASVFVRVLGKDNVVLTQPATVSEDFSRYSLDGHQIPTTIFWLGAVDPPKVKESLATGVPLPTLHSAVFAPLPEPTLRTGIKAMTSAVLELMKK